MAYSTAAHRRIAAFLIVAIANFVLFFILAMVLYAGGTHRAPRLEGYSFLTNFFSDTGRTVSFSGKPNSASLLCFAAALVPVNAMLLLFHAHNRALYRGRHAPWNHVATIAGALSAVAAILIPFFPDDLFPTAHLISTLSFSNLLLLSLIGYAVLILKDSAMGKGSAILILGYVGYLCVFTVIVMVDVGFADELMTLLQATGQKIAILVGFTCFLVLALGIRRKLAPSSRS